MANPKIANLIMRRLDNYINGKISGIELSHSISLNSAALEGVSSNELNSLGYFEAFFEMEGEDMYSSNSHLDEAVSELKALLSGLSD